MYFGLSEYNLYNLCKTTECDIIRTATNSRRSMTEKHLMRGGQDWKIYWTATLTLAVTENSITIILSDYLFFSDLSKILRF